MNGKPCGKTAQVRHHAAIFARHQGDHAIERQAAMFDARGEIACPQKFRDAAVDGYAQLSAIAMKQVGLQRGQQRELMLHQFGPATMLFVRRRFIQRVAGHAGQQLDGAQVSGGIEQRFRWQRFFALRLPMLGILFADKLVAGHCVNFHAALGPLVPTYGLHQQVQRLRVAQEFVQSMFSRLAHKLVRIGNAGFVPENFRNIAIAQRIEMQGDDVLRHEL
ncbi:MAG: hypothetical protein WA056_01920 [Gallionella sp.]